MAKKKPAKKRNPNDSTFRNITALKKKITDLDRRVSLLEGRGARFGSDAGPDVNADPSSDLT